ncbi:carbohydrate kinase family protein [Deinococcus sp.]|uniref:carbohydrate kinase family protein n=1 Tax=Deinococcus sp. TaxID=47478 RepID=UPI002869BB28|nr:carbohydrate kinase family protein [Deinococcus sp.]
MDVISAGIVIADCVARPVRRPPEPGQLELVDEIGLYLGGSAVNTGSALTRLGVDVALVGRVGRDGFGDFLAAGARALGLDTRFLARTEAATSATLVHVEPGGERSFLHAVGANAHLRAADMPLEALAAEGARALHVAGFYVLPGLEPEVPDLFARASGLGLLTSLDTVWDATDHWERIHAALDVTDVFCPGLGEAQRITGCMEPFDALDGLLALGVRRAAAVKMGPDGVLLGSPDGVRLHVKAASVNAVDGTGAGDAFIGGFLASLLRGESLADAGRLGCAAGALCVSAMGATSGLGDLPTTRALADTLSVHTLPSSSPTSRTRIPGVQP